MAPTLGRLSYSCKLHIQTLRKQINKLSIILQNVLELEMIQKIFYAEKSSLIHIPVSLKCSKVNENNAQNKASVCFCGLQFFIYIHFILA